MDKDKRLMEASWWEAPWKKSYDQPRQQSKSRDITLLTKVCLVKAMVFPVVMYGCELDCKEGWVPKNWCFWTVLLEKTLESPLDCKEIKPLNPKGNQSWVFIGLKLQYFSDLMQRTDSLEDPDAGKDWRQEEKGMTEDEMVGKHHQLNGHEFKQAPGVGDG